jgi:ABC-2 type transport system ATP-binding protein
MSIAIKIDSLSKTYPQGKGKSVAAVSDLHLTVPQGKVFGFLGANGAGKTTTIKMICGLITPTAGHIAIQGYDNRREHRQAMKQVGAILEGARNIYWRLSAWENVLYFGQLKGQSLRYLKPRAEQLLRDLDLWDRRDQSLSTFSRGMQQKVAIACSLIADPNIILMDEPTLGLDIEAAQTVKTWIKKLVKEQGKAIVLTTHQLDIAQELCDHIAIMRKGCLVADQPIADMLNVFRQEHYQIELKGYRPLSHLSGIENLHIDQAENGNTILSGALQNQNENTLNGLLDELLALNVPILAITRREANLEDIFMHLMHEK